MNFTYYKFCLLLVSVFLVGNIPLKTNALELNNGDRSKSFYLANNREYTFKAPDSKTVSNPKQLTKAQAYKVQVYGGTLELQQVRSIEPTAFMRGNIIQAGTFTQQANAEDLLRKLAMEGLWARIIVH